MEEKLKKKLKKKIWLISFAILSIYIITLIMNPAAWLTLLPIIIPATALTIGIPGYSIMKTAKETLENEANKHTTKENDTKNNQSIKSKDKIIESNQIDNIDAENLFEPQYEYEHDIPHKRNKIKTKGTRY